MKNEEGLSYPYRQLALSAIKHYYEFQTDTILNWKKISKFLGKQTRANDVQAYEREDIQKLLDVANQKFKAIILTYASTGMRRTPVAHLKLGELQNIEDYGLYKITIYRRVKEEQICFTTPEAATAINVYLESRRRAGEILSDSSPLFRKDYDKKRLERILSYLRR